MSTRGPNMSSTMLDSLRGRETRRFEPGDVILREGESSGFLYVLVSGSVEVLKNDVPVALAAQPGVVFGEMAVLLGTAHTATVRAVAASEFLVIDDPRDFLKASPDWCLHICEMLARRLDSLNNYLVDVKRQFEGSDHLGMVDEVLETLLHRQPRDRTRPKPSTIGHGESPD
jgi:CRP-like cAMP-binding protein